MTTVFSANFHRLFFFKPHSTHELELIRPTPFPGRSLEAFVEAHFLAPLKFRELYENCPNQRKKGV